jgi:hypothetical protein
MKTTLLVLALSLNAFALGVQGGRAIITGPHCNDGNTRVVFSPDNATFTILYDELSTSTRDGVRSESAVHAPNKICRIRIPFTTARGKQVELQQVDYRGFVSAPSDKAYGVIESKHRFPNGTVVVANGRWPSDRMLSGLLFFKQGPFQENVTWAARYSPTASSPNMGLHVSLCDGAANLDIETSIRAHSFDPADEVEVMLDSADATLGASATYKVVEKNCDEVNRRRERVCRRGTCPQG